MHRIILICKIKITFQKVSDNFAFIKNCITLWHKCASVRLCVCASVRLCVCASARLRVCASARLMAAKFSGPGKLLVSNFLGG